MKATESLHSKWSIKEDARATRNLRNLEKNLTGEPFGRLLQSLQEVLPGCPDPDMALNNLDRFVAGLPDPARDRVFRELDASTLETLLRLFSSSQFLSDLLVVHPELLDMVQLPLRHSPSRDELLTELTGEVDQTYEETACLRAFCKFHRRHMLRIGVNDLIRQRPLNEITGDISRIADISLEVALRTARKQVSQRFGEPRTTDGQPAQCVILAFGKHGGEELNYSSDIDLMFLYDEDGETRMPACNPSGKERIQHIGNDDYFARVVTKVVRLLTTFTDHGQAYRVDLRLRPEGERGPLARSLASTMAYYDTLGRTWERQALIKVRPAAGDVKLGQQFCDAIEPFVYRKYLSLAEINEIRALKRRIEQRTHRQGATDTEVKTGFGGIRDVEFTIQFLQLLNGDMPQVRQRNTLRAIQSLVEIGCLTHQEYQILTQTYRFLREIEHRLQLMFNLQTHRLPDKESELRRLALLLGYSDKPKVSATTRFQEDYRQKTELNRRILDHLLHEAFSNEESAAEPETDLILDPNPSAETIQDVLGRYPFQDVGRAYQNLTELARESVPFLSTQRCRHFLASIAPHLLRAVAETPDPDMALVNLEKVSDSLGGKGVLWELFSFSRPALRLYVDLCAWSQFLVDILINSPGMIDDLLDSLILNRPRTGPELHEELDDLCGRADDPELILHSFRDKELLRIGVRDILGKDSLKETTAALSDLAEAVLSQITNLQHAGMRERFGIPYLHDGPRKNNAARFVILGLGKLGGREMSYHSDLDLILIYEGDGQTGAPPDASRFDEYESIENYHYFTELAQRIIKAAGYMGPRGRLYQVDMRLRPTGKSGSLVIPIAEFSRYYQSAAAQLWERQALTRARVVYGDEAFAKEVMTTVESAAFDLDWQPTMADDIAAMRRRVQASGSQRDVKRGYGGIIDVEFLVQLFRLKYGRQHEGLRATNTWDALNACQQANLVSEEEYQSLWSSYVFLRLVESRLRIVHNRSLDELPEDEDDLSKLARRLGFEATAPQSASGRFLAELDQCLTQTRELFVRLVERERS